MISEFAGSGMLPLLDAVVKCEKRLWLAKKNVVRILAVDPGVITGVCVLWIDADTGEILAWAETLITHDETKMVWDLMALLRTLADCGRVWIVIEDFRVDQVNMSDDFLSPVRVGQKFAFGAEIMKTGELGEGPVFGAIETVTWQSRGRKADYQDARLKKLGFFTEGPDHRRDATRHALVRWKKLKLELPTGVKTRAAWWEPALTPAADLGPRTFGRSFNGKPTGSHGQPGKTGVTREDMERMAQGRRNGKTSTMAEKMVEAVKSGELTMLATSPNTEVSDVMKSAAATNGMKWVPMPNGAAGWVLEHDPLTQSGIAPRSGSESSAADECPPLESFRTGTDSAQKPPTATSKRRRVMKKLV